MQCRLLSSTSTEICSIQHPTPKAIVIAFIMINVNFNGAYLFYCMLQTLLRVMSRSNYWFLLYQWHSHGAMGACIKRQ